MAIHVVVIYDADPERPMHVFGPFPTMEAAGEWGGALQDRMPNGDCDYWQATSIGPDGIPFHSPDEADRLFPNTTDANVVFGEEVGFGPQHDVA